MKVQRFGDDGDLLVNDDLFQLLDPIFQIGIQAFQLFHFGFDRVHVHGGPCCFQ